ncbi:MAG: DUF58 domain-containing protein, partial [Thermoanaerobaculia bacterium]
RRRQRRTPEGIRITKVGLWYVLFAVLVAIAATNTGNNALYLVVAVMLGALVVSGISSRQNVGGLEADLTIEGDVFANQPAQARFVLRNPSRWLPRWFLLISASRGGVPRLVPYLPAGGTSRGRLELLLPRRGRRRVPAVHLASLFPFGFFRKGVRYHTDREILVYPEIYPAATAEVERTARSGEVAADRAGWGHDLYALRPFRHGDDPRGIHWKQTARTGRIIYMERESEESRRLSVLFDNGVGRLRDEEARQRFERLVSEAATTALDYLARGFAVELVTRDGALPFTPGRRQRVAILEHLALVEPAPRSPEPLRSRDAGAPQVRIGARPGAPEEEWPGPGGPVPATPWPARRRPAPPRAGVPGGRP